jgi:hypothetical protein
MTVTAVKEKKKVVKKQLSDKLKIVALIDANRNGNHPV